VGERLRQLEGTLKTGGKVACLIIATDGESTDGNVVDVLKPLEGLPLTGPCPARTLIHALAPRPRPAALPRLYSDQPFPALASDQRLRLRLRLRPQVVIRLCTDEAEVSEVRQRSPQRRPHPGAMHAVPSPLSMPSFSSLSLPLFLFAAWPASVLAQHQQLAGHGHDDPGRRGGGGRRHRHLQPLAHLRGAPAQVGHGDGPTTRRQALVLCVTCDAHEATVPKRAPVTGRSLLPCPSHPCPDPIYRTTLSPGQKGLGSSGWRWR
jgi:hypothetical protein